MVVPAVLDLYNSVIKNLETTKYLRKMLLALRDSLKRRFLGIFVRCRMAVSMAPEMEGFHHKVYLVAALLDPNTKLAWVDLDVNFQSDLLEDELEQADVCERKDALKRDIQGK